MQSGGRKFAYVPALNASAGHVRFLADLICQHTQGWTDKGWAQLGFGLGSTGTPRGARA
jgi:ferrochelatase